MWIKRLVAWIKGGKVVWLKDMDGEVVSSIAYKDPWGELRAERHWPLNIKSVVLKNDGSVEGSGYVKFWAYDK